MKLTTFFLCLFLSFFSNADTDNLNITKHDKIQLESKGISIREPSLDYSYNNALIPIDDPLDYDSVDGYYLEKNIRDLNNNKASTATIEKIKKQLISKIKSNRETFNYMVGYHSVIPPDATVNESIRLESSGLINLKLLGRYGQKINALCRFKEASSDLILLIPGRGTDISSMFGLKKKDYTNNAALYYAENTSFNVCAIENYRRIDIALKRYGLSGKGVVITNATDFIKYLSETKDVERIFVGGVSAGGHMAEYIAVIEDKVDGVLSVGSAARYDYPYSVYSEIELGPKRVFAQDGRYVSFNFLFSGKDIYKMIYPKALLVSIGTHDAGYQVSSTSPKHHKISLILDAKAFYESNGKGNCFKANVFKGGHGMDPEGEAIALNELINECL